MKPLALVLLTVSSLGASSLPSDDVFKVETIAEGLSDPMEMAITPEGYLFVAERAGAVKLVRPTDGKTVEIAKIPVKVGTETKAPGCGLLGITLDPDYGDNKWVYVYYSAPGEPKQRLSRFTFAGRSLEDEKTLLEVPHERGNKVTHEGGSLAFGPGRQLFLSTGDNTCPLESDGYAPIDKRRDRREFDAQRTSSNTNDLRGKILRIIPNPDGTYAIPDGNLFPAGTASSRPEIFAMGCRNPHRIVVDPHDGTVYWADTGPGAEADSERGPRGHDEINRASEAGNFGWPYFIADNKPYTEYDFASQRLRKTFDPDAPVNYSPNNTGSPRLPKAVPSVWHQPSAATCAGVVYHFGDYPDSAARLPEAFDSSLIVFDSASGALRVVKIAAAGEISLDEPWLAKSRFTAPGDMTLDNEGRLWLLEYGSSRYNGTDGKLKLISSAAP